MFCSLINVFKIVVHDPETCQWVKKSKIPWRDKKFSVAEIAGENHNSDNAN